MKTIQLASVETCILAAHQQYLKNDAKAADVATADGTVRIDCGISGFNFNCGMPGFNMKRGDADALKSWCCTHPGDTQGTGEDWGFGWRGTDSDKHVNTVNVTLQNQRAHFFNFHVNLT